MAAKISRYTVVGLLKDQKPWSHKPLAGKQQITLYMTCVARTIPIGCWVTSLRNHRAFPGRQLPRPEGFLGSIPTVTAALALVLSSAVPSPFVACQFGEVLLVLCNLHPEILTGVRVPTWGIGVCSVDGGVLSTFRLFRFSRTLSRWAACFFGRVFASSEAFSVSSTQYL